MNRPTIPASQLADWLNEQQGPGAGRFVFGIAGAPGSGKSTIANRLAHELDAVVVPMDGFHLPNAELDQRGLRSVKGAPKTFDAAGFVEAIRAVRRGDADVLLPDFNRETDEPRPDRIRVPASARLVVVEGNYLLLDSSPWDQLRESFDAVAHLGVDAELRVQRLIERHVRFGKTAAQASAFVHASDEANALRVEAVRHRAHLIVDTES